MGPGRRLGRNRSGCRIAAAHRASDARTPPPGRGASLSASCKTSSPSLVSTDTSDATPGRPVRAWNQAIAVRVRKIGTSRSASIAVRAATLASNGHHSSRARDGRRTVGTARSHSPDRTRRPDPSVLGLRRAGSRARPRSGSWVEGRTNRTRLAFDQKDVRAEDRRAVQERRPQVLALAGTTLVVQGGEHAHHRHHGVGGIGHAEAEIGAPIACHRTSLELQAARRLVERVQPTETDAAPRRRRRRCCSARGRVCAAAPRSRYRDVAVPLVIMMHHIGDVDARRNTTSRPSAGFDVDRDVELAPLAAEEGHAGHPHAVAADRFHFDDLGPQIRQKHRAVRPGQVLAQVEDDDAAQRAHEMSSTIPAPSRRSISAASYPASASTWRLCAPAAGLASLDGAGQCAAGSAGTPTCVVRAELAGSSTVATMPLAMNCG